uniref:Uncharacterized protein n=1 Tax=Opuntia streptacantha TaxID=393608 RepID=A0A7C9CDZ1_OPUST
MPSTFCSHCFTRVEAVSSAPALGNTSDCKDGEMLFTCNHVSSQKLSPPKALLCTSTPPLFITNSMFFSSSSTNSWSLSLLLPLILTFMYFSIRLRTHSHSLQNVVKWESSGSNRKNTLERSFIAIISVASILRKSFSDCPCAISSKSSSIVNMTTSKHWNQRLCSRWTSSISVKHFCNDERAWFLTPSL